jgi:diaminohydroxyphosphoribosylaminopyrimidine deaminase / 5-amino-6-(5-phosphoribosylamino)uracil reductase
VVATTDDEALMERALFWGARGRGRTSPNPSVGAVVVSPEGIVVGQGTTQPVGGAHAEVVALEAAGGDGRGGTLYCTLEPCCHAGRTGPCVERIVAAGIARAVVAVEDVNPEVAGRGIEFLRAHGVDVTVGVGADEARRQHAPFFTWITARRPFVVLKAAASLDGFVGEPSARVKLTGPVADRYFQRQRAEVDAIAVGSGTVLTDDPLLTARGSYRFRPLTRVIFDWRARIPASARVFSTIADGPVVMAVTTHVLAEQPAHFAELQRLGVEVLALDTRDLRVALAHLAERSILSLLVEGGPTLHAALAEAGLVDRAQWIVTPRELGTGIPLAAALGPSMAPNAPRRTTALGPDMLIEFDVDGLDRGDRPH